MGKDISPHPGYCLKPKMWGFSNFFCVVNDPFYDGVGPN